MLNAKTYCVPNSILCAWTWGAINKTQVRISISKIDESTDHAQAQALINGDWIPLTEIWADDHMEVTLYRSHYPEIEPYRYLTLREWIDEQIQYTQVEAVK